MQQKLCSALLMEYIPNLEVIPIKTIDELLRKIQFEVFQLQQETTDKAQLSPKERLISIQNVWNIVKNRIGNPETALDVGSGFGYGTVFLYMNNIKVIGIENVHSKNIQAIELFSKLNTPLNTVDILDFDKSPALFEVDFTKMEFGGTVDLITMFYLSGELIVNPETFVICRKLLKKDGKILLSTEANRKTIEEFIKTEKVKLPSDFIFEIIDIPDNFEKTAILLSKI